MTLRCWFSKLELRLRLLLIVFSLFDTKLPALACGVTFSAVPLRLLFTDLAMFEAKLRAHPEGESEPLGDCDTVVSEVRTSTASEVEPPPADGTMLPRLTAP